MCKIIFVYKLPKRVNRLLFEDMKNVIQLVDVAEVETSFLGHMF